ncbi:hypothetical protein A3A93_00805 [Candidatus Roizmanbacteria bacterium RIFCSPLOWO2_01_FULL_38_12]|uniref:Uncharacterized protein n=1 Tax=Candidatus Roizmanbacteria bacterium RIFCSPLOWO2_01_FULL_38_12 TaxID=1802061 RepID=A0A1F7IVL1_9BACT|nr:MAG: hypothetical protein A2861_04325 [Candidatus Roizmanbacteria bacterium RIFCSPHIGHO2_01_FULL_38_15]OGK34796.1 MAG: hypothetical protein A3F59_05930 [Candidatus Roizmanbacteria bacterium RIFCSPHIGHO2_12_FULL_38_13]OGK47400.1 MAG: hypothetical protein A3A93_00805 [Candidatus Roizmanbacteria bacterium RIFCSPLOWO2_01_FULL_38_12]
MRFTFPFLKTKKEKPYYFCLYINDHSIDGFVLETIQGSYKIRAEKKRRQSSGFDKILEDTDNLISDLEMKVSGDLSKTIFFLPTQMIDAVTHEIKDPHKTTIKKISSELELEPLGYIDIQEAIQGYINQKSFVNCMVVQLSESEIEVTIYKGGVVAHTQYCPRTDDVASDLEEVLKSVPDKRILPTKIIIYGATDNEKVSSTITSHDWDEKIFAEHPTITALSDGDLYKIFADTFVKELIASSSEEDIGDTLTDDISSAGSAFGFVFGGDIRDTDAQEPQLTHTSHRPTKKKTLVQFINKINDKVKSLFSKKNMSAKNAKGRKNIIIVLIILIGAGLLFIGYEYFFHKATITVYLQSKSASDSIDLTLPVTETPSGKKLTVVTHTKVVEFNDKKVSTGTRDVGEKAKGDVSIHNFDNSERNIERGTKIIKGELEFVLDNDVKIASSSGITSDGTKQSGKAKVSVTADAIGSAHNISKDTQLTIASLPESLYIAIADADFTGGTQKKIKTVSRDDLDALEANAKKEAKNNAAKEQNIKVSNDELLITDLNETEIASTVFSKEVGEEADTVSIKANTEINYFTVSKKLLHEKIKEELLKDNKEYTLSDDSLVISFENAANNVDEVELAIGAKADIYKDIDTKKLLDELPMSSVRTITGKLQEKYNVEDVKLTEVSPSFGGFVPWIPIFRKNIKVVTSSK